MLWDLAQRRRVFRKGLLDEAAPYQAAAISPDGDLVVCASTAGGAVVVSDLEGRNLARIQTHYGGIRSVVFCPSGDRLLVGCEDGTARVLSLSGDELDVLRGHDGPVYSACFSPAGDRILTASADGTARLWLARGRDLLELADAVATRDFTESERERYVDLLPDPE